MSFPLLWLGVGLILVVAELVTGTFYLLVLGLACLAGAAVSFSGLGIGFQTSLAALVAIFGTLWVRRHRSVQPVMPSLELGQPVRWESWISETDRLARVNYRGASWDAKVEGECSSTPDEVFYITQVTGSQLTVSKAKP